MKTIELELTGIAHGGEALGRHEGKVYFVPDAIPGERVVVDVMQEKAQWARCRLQRVLRASPDRVTPPCPYTGHAPGRCGGCQWQHIAYARQLALKREILQDQLARLGRRPDVTVHPTLAVDEPYRYRNSAQLTPAGGGKLGFMEHASHRVVPIASCLLLRPALDALLPELEIDLPELTELGLRQGDGAPMVILQTADDEPPQVEVDLPISCAYLDRDGLSMPLIGDEHLTEQVGGHRFRISPASFFQVNTPGAAALVEVVRRYLAAEPSHTLLDAYGGVGLFALSLAGDVARVVGIEASPAACDDFRANAAGLPHVSLIEADVAEGLAQVAPPVHRVVVDPPRQGLGKPVVEALAALRPLRLVYVSCDPATLARDTALLEAAGYPLQEVQPLDLFPQTSHVEAVAWFRPT